jgi:hypothetical protein
MFGQADSYDVKFVYFHIKSGDEFYEIFDELINLSNVVTALVSLDYLCFTHYGYSLCLLHNVKLNYKNKISVYRIDRQRHVSNLLA